MPQKLQRSLYSDHSWGFKRKKFWDLRDILWYNTPGNPCRLLGEGSLSSLFPTAGQKSSGFAATAAFWESHQTAQCCRKIHSKKSPISFIWKIIQTSLHDRAGPRHDLWSKRRGSSWVRYPNPPFHLELQDTNSLPQNKQQNSTICLEKLNIWAQSHNSLEHQMSIHNCPQHKEWCHVDTGKKELILPNVNWYS